MSQRRNPRYLIALILTVLGDGVAGFPSPSELPLSYLLEESSREAASLAVQIEDTADAVAACLSTHSPTSCEGAARSLGRYPGTGAAYREILWRLSHLPPSPATAPVAVAKGVGKPPFTLQAQSAIRLIRHADTLPENHFLRREISRNVERYLDRDAGSPHSVEQAAARQRIRSALRGKAAGAVFVLKGPAIEEQLCARSSEVIVGERRKVLGEWAKQIQFASREASPR